jgi:hypothetical protein
MLLFAARCWTVTVRVPGCSTPCRSSLGRDFETTLPSAVEELIRQRDERERA